MVYLPGWSEAESRSGATTCSITTFLLRSISLDPSKACRFRMFLKTDFASKSNFASSSLRNFYFIVYDAVSVCFSTLAVTNDFKQIWGKDI